MLGFWANYFEEVHCWGVPLSCAIVLYDQVFQTIPPPAPLPVCIYVDAWHAIWIYITFFRRKNQAGINNFYAQKIQLFISVGHSFRQHLYK